MRNVKTLYQWCIENKNTIILKEWDYSNNVITPKDVSFASHKEVWWKCSKCGNEWKTTVKNRKCGTGCKKCSLKTISYKLSVKSFDESLSKSFPTIAKEWDYSKNKYKPTELSPYSEKKVWWICSNGHSYNQTIYQRAAKNCGCPYCGSKKVLKGFNDLQTLKPNLAKEWNYKKNGNLKPTDVTENSNKKVWWICSKGHEWNASINNRNHLNRGCPYCSGNKPIVGVNDLASVNKEVAKQWDYEKNGSLKPSDVLPNSNKKYWWKCSKGHSFQQSAYYKTNNENSCPYCSNQKLLTGFNDLETRYPKLAREWHPIKNNKKPHEVLAGGKFRAWWMCSKGHVYSVTVHNKIAGNNCPYCANKKLLKGYNDLQTTNPELVREWDYEKNGDLKPTDVIAGSHTKVWWICKNKHHYKAYLVDRKKGTGCPICNKNKKSSFPEQAVFYYIKQAFADAINGYKNKDILGGYMEFDIYIPSINTAIEYDGMVFHDSRRLDNDLNKYKRCIDNGITLIRIAEKKITNNTCDFLYETNPNDINSLNDVINNLIIKLNGKTIEVNINKDKYKIQSLLERRKINLVDKYPNIAKQWNYKKNYPLVPENVAPKTNLKVWWICSKGHEWQSPILYRTSKNSECPICSSYKLPKYAKISLAEYRKDVADMWDYEKNELIKPENVGGKSQKKAWFKCKECNYSWNEQIKNITKRSYICPNCKKS